MTFGMVRHSLSVSILAMSVAGTATYAQVAVPGAASAAVPQGEIVVTAQKRTETLSKVPASISVLNGGAMGAGGIRSIDDLTRAVPGISFSAGSGGGTGPGNSTLAFRGVSSQGAEATVGVYSDETSITNSNRSAGAVQPMALDLARVEVLRGPQGTLYGASSEGGAVRYIHNKPNLTDFGGYIEGGVSDTAHGGANYETSSVVNVPLIASKLAVRVGGLIGRDSGWIDNYDLSGNLAKKGVNSAVSQATRFDMLFKPSDDLTIEGQVNYQRYKANDSGAYYDESSGEAPYKTTGGRFKQSKEVPDTTNDKVLTASLQADYKFSGVQLTSVSSIYDRWFHRVADGTYYNSGALAQYYFPALASGGYSEAIATLPSAAAFPVNFHTLSQELRLTSLSDGPLRWVGGVYASSQITDGAVTGPETDLASTFQAVYGYPITNLNSSLGVPAGSGTGYWSDVYNTHGHSTTLQLAAFGQVDYTIAHKLHLSAGLRYQFSRQTERDSGSGFFYIGIPASQYTSAKYNNVTPKFTVSYDIGPRSSVYASAGEGFRIGGPVGSLPTGTGNVCQVDYDNLGLTSAPTGYKPDKLWSYEAGVKYTTPGRHLNVNAAGYYIDWKNLQQNIALPTCGFSYTSNVGNARSYGGEIELHYSLPFLPQLRLGVSGSYTKAELTAVFQPFASVGQAVLNVPKETANVSGDYGFPVANFAKGTLHVDYNYIGKSHGSFQTYLSNYTNDAYGIMNANLQFRHDKWMAEIFVKNLLDDHTVIQRPTIASVVEDYTATPRTVGFNLRRDF